MQAVEKKHKKERWMSDRMLIDPEFREDKAIFVFADQEGTHASIVEKEAVKIQQLGEKSASIRRVWRYQRDFIFEPNQNDIDSVRDKLKEKRNVDLVEIKRSEANGNSWSDFITHAKNKE